MSFGGPAHTIRHLRRWWRWHFPQFNCRWVIARLRHTLRCRKPYEWIIGDSVDSTACSCCGVWRWFPVLLPLKGGDH